MTYYVDDKPKEECGVAGVFLKDVSENSILVPETLCSLLLPQQHRGQSGTGIAVHYRPREGEYAETIRYKKRVRLVADFFRIATDAPEEATKLLELHTGTSGLGHVRYGTFGQRDYSTIHLQPSVRDHGRQEKRFAFCWNGHLANAPELEKRLYDEEGYVLQKGSDTEILNHLISLELKRQQHEQGRHKFNPDFFELSQHLILQLDGAYNILLMLGNGDIGAIRDPLGFKPLVWAENKDLYAIVSESVALRQIGIDGFNIVDPGSAILFNKKEPDIRQVVPSEKKAHCHFEVIYFEDDDSHFEGTPVQDCRIEAGRLLAKRESLDVKGDHDYIVVPVPRSANAAAIGYAQEMGVIPVDAIKKLSNNRVYINSPSKRKSLIKPAFSIKPWRLKDKKVIVIEDSVMRSQTITHILEMIRGAGAKEVHVRSTEPPVKHPCFYGIDHSTHAELVANRFPAEILETRLAEKIRADSFMYQTLDDLVKCTGKSADELCLACVNGEYPTEFGKIRCEESRQAAAEAGHELFL